MHVYLYIYTFMHSNNLYKTSNDSIYILYNTNHSYYACNCKHIQGSETQSHKSHATSPQYYRLLIISTRFTHVFLPLCIAEAESWPLSQGPTARNMTSYALN